jgi:histone acetyltransferase (RNA polymerase elongator complex component)
MIIPFFIPHFGCLHQCVFCNQKNITGHNHPDDASAIPDKIDRYLSTHDSLDPVEIAFYGGSFTALSLAVQQTYLETVRPFIQAGSVRNIRLSTRPDCISSEILTLLREYEVTVIELGAQSLDDSVLIKSGRGHKADDVMNAVNLLKEYEFAVGLQLMPGLPGDTASDFIKNTIAKVIAAKPDFVRIYPVLVIRSTPLEILFRKGYYLPLTLDEAIAVCSDAIIELERADIPVIRIGLQPTEELRKTGTLLAGPFHPAFRQLVDSSLFLNVMRSALKKRMGRHNTAEFSVNPRDVSSAIGQRRCNIRALIKEFKLEKVRIIGDSSIHGKREIKLSIP